MALRALCIGVNAYQDSATLRPLHGCANDAKDVGALLAAHGFTVKVLLDAGGEEMHDEVEALVAQCGEADRVVVMLSGHGAQYENDNYLFPADFNTPKRSGVLRDTARDALAVHGDIVERLQRRNARGLNVVITDMCRSSTRFRGQGATRGAGDGGGIVKREDIAAGTLVAFACEQGHTSLDTGRNGCVVGTEGLPPQRAQTHSSFPLPASSLAAPTLASSSSTWRGPLTLPSCFAW